MKLMKPLFVVFVLALLLAGSFPHAVKADDAGIKFVSIQLNGEYVFFKGKPAGNLDHINVKPGENLLIQVAYENTGTSTIDDVRVSARVLGYEFGNLVADSDIDKVIPGQNYLKTLNILIPDDIDTSQTYTLRVEISSPISLVSHETQLEVDENRHDINFFPGGITITPAEKIMAGRPMFVEILLENKGGEKEENIEVQVRIPQLGVSATGFIPELIPRVEEQKQKFDTDEESSDSVSLLLRPPEDAPSGDYDLQITVLYNRGHDVITATKKITIQGVEKEVPTSEQTVVNVDSQSKQGKPGEEVAYKISIANLASTKGLYTISVDGVDFGEVRVDPSFVSINPTSTGEARVYVTPFATAEAKDHTFVIRVMQDRDIVSEVSSNFKVLGNQKQLGTTFKSALAVIFAVLVIVLIILGLVVAFRRMQKEEEPSVTEGQTYYYNPRH